MQCDYERMSCQFVSQFLNDSEVADAKVWGQMMWGNGSSSNET